LPRSGSPQRRRGGNAQGLPTPGDGQPCCTLTPYDDGSHAVVQLLRTGEHLWACISGLQMTRREEAPSVSLHLDADGCTRR